MRSPDYHSSRTVRQVTSLLLTVALVTGLVTGLAAVAQNSDFKIQVTREEGGYRLRYRDPDFDDALMEVFVRDASRLSSLIVGTVSRGAVTNSWRYDYEAINSEGSDQQLASWSMQVQTGSEIAASPTGWRSRIDRAGLSLFTTSATGMDQVRPGTSRTGWTILSDSLPEVKEATVRGSAQLDVDSADVPAPVRRRLAELEQGNTARVSVIVPWIPTRQIAIGYEGPIDPGAILRRAVFSYSEPLLAAVAPDSRGGREQVSETLRQLELAQAALVTNNKASALDALRSAVRRLDAMQFSERTQAVPAALKLILEYVTTRIR